MGLKCSLIGHSYDESEVERDREVRGDEVVITTREYDVCTICGARMLVSENKEVTSNTKASPSPADQQATDTDDTPDVDTGVRPSAATSQSDSSPGAATGSTAYPDTDGLEDVGPEPDYPTDPEQDDAVILDADDESDDAGWPDADEQPTSATPTAAPESAESDTATDTDRTIDETQSPSATGWPDHERESEDSGVNATTPSEDVSMDDIDFGGGLSPTADDEPGDIEQPDVTTAGGPELEVAADADASNELLVCPACEFEDGTDGGSLREGDVCPKCLDDYLVTEPERNK